VTKIPEKNQLKGRQTSLGSQFTVRSGAFNTIVSWPMVRQNIMVGSMWWNKAAHILISMRERKRERERERESKSKEEGEGFPISPSAAHPQWPTSSNQAQSPKVSTISQ
jgi:hypothetical protein